MSYSIVGFVGNALLLHPKTIMKLAEKRNMKRLPLVIGALLATAPAFAQQTLQVADSLRDEATITSDADEAPQVQRLIGGQEVLSLDDCRMLALQHNKELQMAQLSLEKVGYERQAALTNYLPKIDFVGTYQRTSKSIDLLSEDQKNMLSSMGNTAAMGIQQSMAQSGMQQSMQQLAGQIIQANPQMQPLVMQTLQMTDQYTQYFTQQMAQSLNAAGQGLVDALNTDSRNLGIMSIMFTQPLYMGGKIRAYDRITHYSEELAGQKLRQEAQEIVLNVDKAYWQVISLLNKRKLAEAYRDMLRRLDDDVLKMIREGVATKASELTVSVKLNEAEMTLLRIDDGLVLSRMLLAQTCGFELDETPRLADEDLDNIAVQITALEGDAEEAFAHRPELQQLHLATHMLEQKAIIERSNFLPQLALTGGYLTNYPALTHGFEKRLRGMWNVGVTLKVPLWHWGESLAKLRAARTDVALATLRYDEAREKIQLQVKQTATAVNEANRKLVLSDKNIEKAEENLRVARIGFAEGMIPTSDLLAAQTAWLSAQSDKIDAQIDIMLTRAAYNKALGMPQK